MTGVAKGIGKRGRSATGDEEGETLACSEKFGFVLFLLEGTGGVVGGVGSSALSRCFGLGRGFGFGAVAPIKIKECH